MANDVTPARAAADRSEGRVSSRLSQKTQWQRFVERRRAQLHADYPCAAPTDRRRCPRHKISVPQSARIPGRWEWREQYAHWSYVPAHTVSLSGICKPCRDGLYERLAAEHVNAATRAA
jgi:hypothetical protein